MDDVETLRAIRISKILGLPYTNRRISVRCPLPTHSDKSASFCIYPEDNSYYCFGCNAHGTGAIDFAIALGYSFKDAVRELKDYL